MRQRPRSTKLLLWGWAVLICVALTAPAWGQTPGAKAPAAIPGVVGWWPANSNARDVVGKNNGVLINGAGFDDGILGRAFAFNGVNQFVAVPKAPNLEMSAQVTIAFWMKADPDNNLYACCQGLVTTDFYSVEISMGGVNFFVNTGGPFIHTADVNGGAAVSTGEWHFIAGTYNGVFLQLYVDGQPWGNPRFHSGTILPMLEDSYFAIGSEDGRTTCPFCISTRYFKGMIDEVSVYNRALTPLEVEDLYARGGHK